MANVSYDYKAKGDVPFISQRGMTCWAAGGAMMHAWRYQMKNLSLLEGAEYAGTPFLGYVKKPKALPNDEIPNYAYAMDLAYSELRSFNDIQFYNLMLTNRTPLMVQILAKGAQIFHFCIITRIHNFDGDPTVVVHDPNRSADIPMFFYDLYELMENAASGTTKQVLYYKR